MRKRASTRKGLVVTTIALEGEVHRRLLTAAIEDRAAMTELVRQAVREWLERRAHVRKDGE